MATKQRNGISRHPTAAPVRSPAANKQAPVDRGTSEDDVRARAYELWEAAGRPDGEDVKFWFEAEWELRGN